MRGPRFEDPMRDAYKLELSFKTGNFVMDYGYREGQKKSTGNVHHNLKIPLLGFYTGFNMEVAIVRSEICAFCNGTGAAENAEMLACDRCTGSGKLSTSSHWRSKRTRRARQEGGFDQTVTLGCHKCGSSGTLPSEPCPNCKGEKTTSGQTTVKVYVDPGTMEGHSYTFKGEAEQAPDAVAGDVVLHVGAEEHEDFEREGHDLVCKRNITLAQALLGFKMEIKHLDGRVIEIERNEVTKPGQDHEVPGMGMPIHGKPGEFGKLIVNLNIVFPERIAMDEERGARMRQADRKAKRKRSKGWRGMFGGGEGDEGEDGGESDEGEEGGEGSGEDPEEGAEEGRDEEDEEDEEGYEERQTSTRRGRRSRGPGSSGVKKGQQEGGDQEGQQEGGDQEGGGHADDDAGAPPPSGESQASPAPASSPPFPSTSPPLAVVKPKKGVGMYVEPAYADGGAGKVQVGLRVKGLLPGSPAAESGEVTVGDMLVQVEGQSVGGLKLKQLAPLLLGEEGTVVRLVLSTPEGGVKEVELVRGDPIAKEEL